MTEKRFDFKYEYITLDEGVFATAKDKQNAELISRTLNQLYEENEQLKSTLHFLLNVIQNKCSKDYPKCKEIVRKCFENDFNNTKNDGDEE